MASQAAATRPTIAGYASGGAKATLNSSAKRAASCGVRRVPKPPMTIGGPFGCSGFGSAGESSIE
jgi:hypothetical protein